MIPVPVVFNDNSACGIQRVMVSELPRDQGFVQLYCILGKGKIDFFEKRIQMVSKKCSKLKVYDIN